MRHTFALGDASQEEDVNARATPDMCHPRLLNRIGDNDDPTASVRNPFGYEGLPWRAQHDDAARLLEKSVDRAIYNRAAVGPETAKFRAMQMNHIRNAHHAGTGGDD